MKYKWGIPSYNRADATLTVDLLHRLGYSKSEIIVSTQTQEDYEAYLEKQGGKATIIYKPCENDSMNRNNVIKQFPEGVPILLADDDIKAFCKLSEDGKKLIKIEDGKELEQLFDRMFRYCVKNNAKIWAWYPIANSFFMKHTIDDKNILCGTLFGIINNYRFMFDEEFSLKGDYEISLRYISEGFNAIRFNGYTCEAKHKSKGGCEEARARGDNKQKYMAILKRYPQFIRPSKREGEIRYVGKITHSPEKGVL